MKLLIKFPTRGRPDVFKKTFSIYYNMLSGKYDYEFIVTMDEDDRTMNNAKMIEFLDQKKNITYCFGNSKSKIEAINANMEGVDFDVLLLASDDMVPLVKDYDDVICENMKKFFPDMDGSLHFNDGRAGNILNTLSIMGKKMYDQFGYIYHPDYTSLWCDNEFHDVVYKMKKCIYINQVIIKHGWTDTTGKDSLHARNEGYYALDQAVFEERRKLNYPKQSLKELGITPRLPPKPRTRRTRRTPVQTVPKQAPVQKPVAPVVPVIPVKKPYNPIHRDQRRRI